MRPCIFYRIGEGIFLWGICLCLGIGCQSNSEIDFNRDIRPILNQNCVSCHGGVKRNGALGLSFREEALKGGESGLAAIVPGDPDDSEIMIRLRHSDPEIRMPLDAPPLDEQEIELLERWIAEGAQWDTHWAYRAVHTTKPPQIGGEWGQHPIDAFIRDAQEEQGLEPNGPAPFYRLARRASLDLTGLPADPDQLHFLQAQPDGYSLLIDSLLESPSFGEHWASLWLDLARYADSKGYEKDSHRDLWRYRDWVIRAFNADMPYDSFTLYQLGGDLLPDPDSNAQIATAFHRSAMTNTEGGTEDEAFRIAAVIDRVNTTFSVWQGTTLECVQCHGHPYDPFRQKEYYEAMDFFNQSLDNDLFSDFPWLESFDAAQSTDIDRLSNWLDSATQKGAPPLPSDPIQRISHSTFPRLSPLDCDDFHSIIMYPDGAISNWSNNLQRLDPGPYFVRFNQLDLSDIEQISITYASRGTDGAIEFRIDSLKGRLWAELAAQKTGRIRGNEGGNWDSWEEVVLPVDKLAGKHDVFLVLKNEKQSIPDGIVVVKHWRLGPPNNKPTILTRIDTLDNIRNQAIRTPIMRARHADNSRLTRVFDRGNWMTQTDTVRAEVPDAILSWNAEWPGDRQHFAQWLCQPENPLTARVWVNRIWERLFGRGIVETSEDFGTQGSPPTHPELLDWLAWELVHTHAWHLKPLLREIVHSRTYQQNSQASPAQLKRDPRNTYLARGPRVRLSAEMIRDQALAVSGLLSKKQFGPSVMPPQPEGVWTVIYSGKKWITPEGADRYRRALYTYWRRSSPYPSFTTFDSPSREVCVVRRIPTNTPLQALVTLNDPVYTEAAAALASRMWHASEDDSVRIAWGYTRALSQPAEGAPLYPLIDLLREAQTYYAAHPEAAAQLVEGEQAHQTDLAALTVVANAIMNLDGFITKE